MVGSLLVIENWLSCTQTIKTLLTVRDIVWFWFQVLPINKGRYAHFFWYSPAFLVFAWQYTGFGSDSFSDLSNDWFAVANGQMARLHHKAIWSDVVEQHLKV